MPCRSDYPPLTELESELITIYNINDELDGKGTPYHSYHPAVYGKGLTYEDLDLATAALCKRIQGIPNTYDYSYILNKWWLNHRISDFKRLVKERAESKQEAFFLQKLSMYERTLIFTNDFLESIVDDSSIIIIKRFEGFNDSQNNTWQKNITAHSFIQILAAFEQFCELLYLREKNHIQDSNNLFRGFKESEDLIRDFCKETYSDWLTVNDYSKLNFYFDKYNLISSAHAKGLKMYFDAKDANEEEISKRKVIKEEVLDLIRIVLMVKDNMSKIKT